MSFTTESASLFEAHDEDSSEGGTNDHPRDPSKFPHHCEEHN